MGVHHIRPRNPLPEQADQFGPIERIRETCSLLDHIPRSRLAHNRAAPWGCCGPRIARKNSGDLLDLMSASDQFTGYPVHHGLDAADVRQCVVGDVEDPQGRYRVASITQVKEGPACHRLIAGE
jgi:hypothetical protein